MTIAICIAGYLRNYEQLYPNFKKFILDPIVKAGHTYDIFISTYDELNSKSTFGYKQHGFSNVVNKFDINNVKDTFQPKDIIVNNFDLIKEKFNIKNFNKDIDLNILNPNFHEDGVMFGLSMHYQRYLSNSLKLDYEKTNNVKYDLTLITRADLFWMKKLNIDNFDKDKLYCREIGYDYFLLSSSNNIDKILDVWKKIDNICFEHKEKEYNGFPLYCPEYFLECYLDKIGFPQNLRESIGEDSCLIYPKPNFMETLQFVLNKFNRINEWDSIFS